MKIFDQIEPLMAHLEQFDKNYSLGFVPTMGALHDGHIELIKQAKNENEIVVCSIFVNKIQFNNEEDFIKYPKNIEKDIQLLTKVDCDYLLIPSQENIFPIHYVYKSFDLGSIENDLEGLHRPGHFQGVCNVVERLLSIVKPNKLYLGQKDIQQCMVIKKLLTFIDQVTTIDLKICSTVRNNFGLALSSRNQRLSNVGLEKATILYKALQHAKIFVSENENIEDFNELIQSCIQMILNEGFQFVDYFSILNRDFKTIDENAINKQPYCIVTAATIENVRLIDNIII